MSEALGQLLQLTPDELVRDRYDRFRALGAFVA
jgi:acetyl-CoA carboxylase alpha subunit